MTIMYTLTNLVTLVMNSRLLEASIILADWRIRNSPSFGGWNCQSGCRRVSAIAYRRTDTALAVSITTAIDTAARKISCALLKKTLKTRSTDNTNSDGFL